MRKAFLSRLVNLYRRLLGLYPRRFRDAYGEEMTELFRARLERAGVESERWVAAEALFSLADLVGSALLLRAFPSRRARRRTPRPQRHDPLFARALAGTRTTVRSLARQPSLVVAVVLTLTLGTGATLALFTIADAAILRPLPYLEPDELVSIVQSDPKFGLLPFGAPYLEDLRERTTSFDAVAGFSPSWSLKLTGLGDPRVVVGAYVSDGLFELLGTRPVEGRGFVAADYEKGGSGVVLVTRTFWNRHFGNDDAFSERTIRLEETLHTIVGILPDPFRLPITTSAVSRQGNPAEVLLPFSLNPYAEMRQIPVMNVVGRLRDGVSPERAAAELGSTGESLRADFPETSRSDVTGVLLRVLVTRDSRETVSMLFGAALFLLLIACANVAGLLLARAAGRQSEMAIRASLGARRRQVVAQLLGESLVLALLGSAGGLLLAWGLLESIPALGLAGLPPSAAVRVDPRVVAFALLLATTTSLLFGLAPALHASRTSEAGVLRAARGSIATGRAQDALVAAECALALFLLVGAGLLGRSYWNLLQVDPGFHADGLLQVPVELTSDAYGADERRIFVDELVRRLGELPGVRSVAAVNRLPLSGANVFVGVELEGSPAADAQDLVVDRRVMSPGYLPTMGIPLLEGRDVGPLDAADSTPVAIVNETLALRFWPEGALGRRVRLQLRGGPGPWLTVVGVTGDVRHHGLGVPPEPELYVPYAQAPVESLVAVVRTTADPLAIAGGARTEVWSLDPTIPLEGLGPVSSVVSDSVAEPRFRMIVLNGFGGLALLFAALGVYGITAYFVACQTREIGLRMALGAGRRGVVKLVVGRGTALALWGVGLGLGGALLLSRLLQGLLFGVAPTDFVTFAAVSLLLLSVAVLASYVPARRATRVDPVAALRSE